MTENRDMRASDHLDAVHLLDGLSADARPYQLRIVNKAIRMFAGRRGGGTRHDERPASSVLIESPAGSGKTVMGLMIARWVQHNWGFRVGWVAMRRNLLSQVAEENVRKGFDVDIKFISMFDRRPPEVDLVVVDEAQHDAAMSMANLHSIIRPKRILGLSATPYRADRMKLCFEQIIRDADIHSLIQDGYLSQYQHYTIPKYSPAEVAKVYAREPQRWGKTLVFFHRLHDCRECQQLLGACGFRSEVVTAQTDRQRQIDDFVSGRTQVLLSMVILAEGFDFPGLKTVFCRPSGKACTVQMAGRVLRKHPAYDFKQIVQCRQTRHPFPKTAASVEQYVWSEGTWKALTLNSHIAAISANALMVIAKSRAELPRIIADRRVRASYWWQQFSSEGS